MTYTELLTNLLHNFLVAVCSLDPLQPANLQIVMPMLNAIIMVEQLSILHKCV